MNAASGFKSEDIPPCWETPSRGLGCSQSDARLSPIAKIPPERAARLALHARAGSQKHDVVTIRYGFHVRNVPRTRGYSSSLLLWWLVGETPAQHIESEHPDPFVHAIDTRRLHPTRVQDLR